VQRERGQPAGVPLPVRTHWLGVCSNGAALVTGFAQEPMAVVVDVRDWRAEKRRNSDGGPSVTVGPRALTRQGLFNHQMQRTAATVSTKW
jgi:hypothetical protein